MSDPVWTGARRHETDATDINAHAFLIRQILATIPGSALVQVKAVTNAGGVVPVGFVDVLPLVNQIDGEGVPTKHDVVHNLPYFRLQGGTDAVILDPKVDDIGLAIFAHRDISTVKKTKAQANPGSRRQNDWADGLYCGGFLNGTPTQYVRFCAEGIFVVSPTKVTIQAPNVEVDASTEFKVNSPLTALSGDLTVGGKITAQGDITGGGKSLVNHHHTGVKAGGDTSGPPA